jgi:hypothetical protein
MKLLHSTEEYDSEFFEDLVGGFGAWNLFCIRQERYRTPTDERKLIGRLTFWDADGQFYVETFDADVPLYVLERLIEEARQEMAK